MAYNVTTNLLPAGSSLYVKADATNPSTIETSATFKFYADGTYYIMNSAQSAAVSVTGASIVSWTRISTKEAELVINNPTQDVTITVTAKQAIVPLDYNRPFNVTAKAPIDTRIVLTKEQMVEISDAKMPDYYFCVCKDDHRLYIYDKTNSKDDSLGRFRPIDDYLTFSSEEAKAKINDAIANSVKIAEINQQITNIQGDVTTLQTNVTNLENRVDIVEADVSDLEPRVDTAQEDIQVIQTWINNVKLDGGEVKAYYALTANYTNVTPDVTPTQVEYNKDLTITFTPDSGYILPDTVTVNNISVGPDVVDCNVLKAKWIKDEGKLYLFNTVGSVSYTIAGVKEA